MKLRALNKTNTKMRGQSKIFFICVVKKENMALPDLFEDGGVRQSRPKEGYIISCCHGDLKKKAGKPRD